MLIESANSNKLVMHLDLERLSLCIINKRNHLIYSNIIIRSAFALFALDVFVDGSAYVTKSLANKSLCDFCLEVARRLHHRSVISAKFKPSRYGLRLIIFQLAPLGDAELSTWESFGYSVEFN